MRRDETDGEFVARMRTSRTLPEARIKQFLSMLKLAKAACEQHKWTWQPDRHYA